jgi:short-subunit dehydrogenase
MDRPFTIITGVGWRTSHGSADSPFSFTSPTVKANIGAWTAYELLASGFPVMLIARRKERLSTLQSALLTCFPGSLVEIAALDVTDVNAVASWAESLPSMSNLAFVHSVGLSSGEYDVPNNNPYLPIAETPSNLPIAETEAVVKSLLLMTQGLLPHFRQCNGGRIVVISSMSGIRPFPFGFSHASAKAALHHATRSMALELHKRNILVSEVAPGIVDTGLYDNPYVKASVDHIAQAFGYDYSTSSLPMMSPRAVAEAVSLCLKSEGHVLSINIVANGQWPHLGA